MSDNWERLFGLVLNGNELDVAGNYRSQGGLAGSIVLPATNATQGISGFVGKLTSTPLATSPARLANWTIYPNPSSDHRVQLTAANALAGSVELSLLNAVGQKIATVVVPPVAGNWHYEWNLTTVAKGFYIIKSRTTEGSKTYTLLLE